MTFDVTEKYSGQLNIFKRIFIKLPQDGGKYEAKC